MRDDSSEILSQYFLRETIVGSSRMWQGCPLFDIVYPEFFLPTTTSTTLQDVMKDGFGVHWAINLFLSSPCLLPLLLMLLFLLYSFIAFSLHFHALRSFPFLLHFLLYCRCSTPSSFSTPSPTPSPPPLISLFVQSSYSPKLIAAMSGREFDFPSCRKLYFIYGRLSTPESQSDFWG